jgi:hypothetical protein
VCVCAARVGAACAAIAANTTLCSHPCLCAALASCAQAQQWTG